MSTDNLAEQLKKEDIEYEEKTLINLVSLVEELNLETGDLVNEWLAYSHNNNEEKINEKSFNGFSKHLKLKSAKINKKTRPRSVSKNRNRNKFNNTNIIYTNKTLKPLMENNLRPNPTNNNDDLMNKYLSMSTPSKSTNKPLIEDDINDIENISNINTIPINNNTNNINILQTPIPKNNTYKSRKKSGEIINSLNNNLQKGNNIKYININLLTPINENKYKIIQLNNNNYEIDAKEYRFMHENMHNKQNIIRQRISYIGKQLLNKIKNENKNNNKNNKNDMDIDEKTEEENDNNNNNENTIIFSEIDEISQRECYYLGRILTDGENTSSNKITSGNIILESEDLSGSYSKRIKLDLSSINTLSLFPGQIIAIKGINCMGKEINVQQIYPVANINSNQLHNSNQNVNNMDNGILQIMVGCGPFTPQNSIDFMGSPLHDFGKQIKLNNPNMIILMGPFTDMANELIKNGNINCTYYEYFIHLLKSFIKFIGNNIKIIIIPSVKDIHHFSPFPQCKYEINNELAEFKNLYFLNNPCEFNINNISFGICNSDFLSDCVRNGLTKNISDRLLSMMTHCINQQNFYPLYPSNNRLRMDYNNYKYLYMHKRFDLFIMPSKLQQFAKIYKNTNTICINPSFLTRLNSGGKYAILNIHKSNDYSIHDYTDLIRVDILRI